MHWRATHATIHSQVQPKSAQRVTCIAQLMVFSSLLPGIMGGGRPSNRGSRRVPPCHTLDRLPPLVLPAAGTAAGAAGTGGTAGAAIGGTISAAAAPSAAKPAAAAAAPAEPGAMPAAASSSSALWRGPMSASAMAWWPESEGCTHLRRTTAGTAGE